MKMDLKKENIYTGYQILVNREHPIRDRHSMLYVPVDAQHRDILLETKTASLLAELCKAIHCTARIVPVSGYRSHEEQTKIYRDSLRDNGKEFTSQFVALPDCSEHQTGLAIDLGENAATIDFIRPNFPYEGICKTFRRQAPQYGFIQRYEKDKEPVTGIAHEPWHFRYVGYPHSQIMHDRGLCLEEYISLLKEFPCGGEHLHFTQSPCDFEIFYVKVEEEITSVELPDSCCRQISGNNVDGFILTIWRRF